MTLSSDNFDWVAAREECSLNKVFATLKAQIQQDVESRNKSLYGNHEFKFDLSDNGNSFAVHITSDRPTSGKAVTFKLTDKAIQVIDTDGKIKFETTLTINVDRECRLKVGNEEHESWYVRKLALEDLFFWNS